MTANKTYFPLIRSKKYLGILLLFVLSGHFKLLGQLTATFNANVTEGCNSLAVQFTNTTLNPYTSAIWKFTYPNGATSTQQYPNGAFPVSHNPLLTFGDIGDYSVTLIVSDGVDTDSLSLIDFIHVYPNPIASFGVLEDTACAPFTNSFYNTSSTMSGGFTSVSWGFGDGGSSTSTADTVTFEYLVGGIKNVVLSVTDSNNCTASTFKQIRLFDTPIADFNSTNAVSCTLPAVVSFTDATNIQASAYFWDLGNDSTSTQQNPSSTYLANGVYDVRLIVENPAGCRDTVIKTQHVQVGQINAQINFNKDTLCVGDTLLYAANAADALGYAWNFECCGLSNTRTGSFVIPDSVSGWQTYSLIINSIGGCVDTIIDSILVDVITLDFSTSNPLFYCDSNQTVQLSSLVQNFAGIQQYEWVVGVDTVYTSPGATFNLPNSGYYNASLTVTSNAGCAASLQKDSLFYVFDVFPEFTVSPSRGCAPTFLSYGFDTSLYQGHDINTWNWNLRGDGVYNDLISANIEGPFSVNSTAITNFIGSLEFESILRVTYDNGCIRYDTNEVRLGLKPNPDFTVSVDSSCAQNAVLFTDASTASTPITEWQWSFSDFSSSTDQNPSVLLRDTGYISATLVVSSNGCMDSITIDSAVYISAPYVSVSSSAVDCAQPLDATFTMLNKGADRWYWRLDYLGQTILDSNTLSFAHSFPPSGTYQGTVTAFNDASGCTFTAPFSYLAFDAPLQTRPITDSTCIRNGVLFGINNPNAQIQYTWQFGDGNDTSNIAQVNHIYAQTGTYFWQVLAQHPNMCLDSLGDSIFIGGIYPRFSADISEGCAPLTVQFSDSSTSDFPITSWSWNFGTGAFDTTQNPTYIFTNNFATTVNLTIRNSLGCQDTYFAPNVIYAYNPNPNFTVNTASCIGQTLQFNNTSTNGYSAYPLLHQWDFGDGTTSTQTSPMHQYADTGTYTITLISEDIHYGCIDTLVRTNFATIESYPTANFSASPQQVGCLSTPVVFTDISNSNFPITTWSWNYGDFTSLGTVQNPQHQYFAPGTYDVQLIVGTQGGCKDTLLRADYIQVAGPYLEYTLSSDSICRGGQIQFNFDSLAQVIQYTIDYGDGSKIDTFYNAGGVLHTYNQYFGNYFPVITLWSDTAVGNICRVALSDNVYVHEVIASYFTNDSILCSANAQVQFTSTSQNADSLIWIFGDNTPSVNASPLIHAYPNIEQVYNTQLIIYDFSSGCLDTAELVLHVGNLLDGVFPSDTFMCLYDSMRLFAAVPGLDSIHWSTNASYSSNTSPSSHLSYDINNYQVDLYISDTSGCFKESSILVEVIGPYTTSLSSSPIYLIEGTQHTYNISLNPQGTYYTYQWQPPLALSCITCLNPIASPSETTEYTLTISDSLNCASADFKTTLVVIKEPSIALPTSFTPNGDLNNDVVYVKGLGITQLLEFNIYNRWGEQVYQNPGDLNQGWDGTYKSNLQVPESYAYTVKALAFTGETLELKGYINLLR